MPATSFESFGTLIDPHASMRSSSHLDASTRNAARWHVRLLGDTALVSSRGAVIDRLPSRAAAVLLACLVTAPQRAHAREELIDMLWPDVDLNIGRNRLRQVLSTLKSLLEAGDAGGREGPVIVADRHALRVAPGAFSCDVLAFEAMVRERRHQAARALYRGPLMPGFFDEWVLEERQRLEALVDRLDDEGAEGHDAERGRDGHRVDHEHGERPRESNLPTYLTRLHGIDAVLDDVVQALQVARLVTLVGPGGVGKTRLAVEAARESQQVAAFDPVLFVALVGATTIEAVLDAVAGALRIEARPSASGPPTGRSQGGAPGRDERAWLHQALAGRRALLVLDNCEQLGLLLAAEVGAWLDRLPDVHVLATSRHAIGVDGEQVLVMPALAVPEAHAAASDALSSPAVALFVDRARAARADFHLGARNTGAVIEIVRRLDGMPLAIELAAARVRSFAPPQLLALMSEGDAAPLSLMARPGTRAARDPRHASMSDVIGWSWRLLDERARGLLADVSVFPGSFTLDAARAVTGRPALDAAHGLDELVAHSMLRVVAGGQRLQPYELVREYAATQLAPARAGALRARHRRWALDWAAALPPTPPLHDLREEMPNIVAALASAVADDACGEAVELLARMRRSFEDVSLPAAGLRHLLEACDRCADTLDGARGHALLAGLLFRAGQGREALRCADLALTLLPRIGDAGRDPALRARALHAAASVRWRATKDAAHALTLIDEAEPLAQAAGALDIQASLCALRAFVVGVAMRDDARAEALHRRATDLWQTLGNRHAVNSGLYNQAVIASRSGRPELALERLREVLDSATQLGDERRIRDALNVQGIACMALRRWRDAADALRACVRQAWRRMEMHDLSYGLWNLARVLAHLRRAHDAVRVMGFASTFWTAHFGALSDEDRRDIRAIRRLAALTLSPLRVEAAWREGAAMTTAQVVSLALAADDATRPPDAKSPATS